MPQPFRKLTVAQFEALVKSFPWTRKIDAVHMHHTWRPNRQQYQGEATIEAIWRYHTQVNGWSDIAQHITIAPDGAIWTGRGWNAPPASASGHNGNRVAGPFMFEMVGDFDRGRDAFEDPQKETALRVIVALQKQFKLAPESLRFHNQMSAKSCPGTAIDTAAFLKEVKARQTARRDAEASAGDTAEDRALAPGELFELIEAVRASAPADDPGEAEPAEGSLEEGFYDAEAAGERGLAFVAASRGDGARGEEVTPEMLRLLRKHVINLNQGHLSGNGRFSNLESDVEAIFQEHLPSRQRRGTTRCPSGSSSMPTAAWFPRRKRSSRPSTTSSGGTRTPGRTGTEARSSIASTRSTSSGRPASSRRSGSFSPVSRLTRSAPCGTSSTSRPTRSSKPPLARCRDLLSGAA
jgi:N-acetylmuramoyl-L-alanine amidase